MNFANPTDGREVDYFSNYISAFKKDKIVSLISRLITFSFFIAKKKQQPHSIPLHSIKKYDLEYLEIVVNEIKKHYHLTLTYDGFSGQRWPNSWQMIQKQVSS
ncbi:hypothetical protein [Pediococcus acidilactici]|uniref:hypothetical protein n=1 Tax=Pediococcus acidilactici TaxID=1254 RepID=UPI003CECA697